MSPPFFWDHALQPSRQTDDRFKKAPSQCSLPSHRLRSSFARSMIFSGCCQPYGMARLKAFMTLEWLREE